MSINPSTQYPGKIDTSVPLDYPYGKAKNIGVPGDGTGTPLEAALVNDIFGFQQALLRSAGIVPSGTPEKLGASEYLQAVVALASGRAFNYDESGVADAYVLDTRTDQEAPAAYFDGMVVVFTPGNNNTGASTVNVAGLGVTNLRDANGNVLIEGQLVTTEEYTTIYNGLEFRLSKLYTHTKVSGYDGAQNIIINDDIADSNALDITSVIIDNTGAWESVGPTGSGATHIWSQLNDMPITAKGVTVSIVASVLSYGVIATHRILVDLSVRKNGSAIAGGFDYTKIVKMRAAGYTGSVLQAFGIGDDDAHTEIIPVNSSNMFDIYYTEQSSSDSGSPTRVFDVKMYFKGWIE